MEKEEGTVITLVDPRTELEDLASFMRAIPQNAKETCKRVCSRAWKVEHDCAYADEDREWYYVSEKDKLRKIPDGRVCSYCNGAFCTNLPCMQFRCPPIFSTTFRMRLCGDCFGTLLSILSQPEETEEKVVTSEGEETGMPLNFLDLEN